VNAEKNTRATRATLDKKTSDIAAMFDTVAERYDLMNGILSLGQHIYWRKQAVAAVDAHPGQKVLDVAAGTGVSSEPFADAGVDVIAADLSEGMLDVGRRRRPDMTFVQADVTALPFDDETFDAVTMSYGLRNVANYPKALSEIYRVLKPGGRIVILEFSTPTFAPFGAVYKNYIMKAIPPIARAISSNPESYEYLAESIIAWPNQQELAKKIEDTVSNAEQPIAATDLLGDLDLKLPAGFELIAADPKLGPQILSSLARIEERLAEAIAQTDHLADVASRHLLSAGGKRVRPLLALLCAAVDDEINDEVIEAAVVVELTHLATLYHDDVMDDAPKRRGVDSAQMIWGNSVAILTGDLIFSRASLLVSELGTRPMKIQSQTFERLVLGQLFETTGPREGQDLLDHYIAVIEGKTGSLIAAAGEYGSLLSGASEEVISMVKAYGELVGVAFQLADDVIDIVSDGKTSGKTRGTDLREGVPTLPTILLDRAVAAGDESAVTVRALLDADLSSDEALDAAVEALAAHPVTQEAWQIAYDWADRAIAAIAPLPESTAKAALESFAHAVVHREG